MFVNTDYVFHKNNTIHLKANIFYPFIRRYPLNIYPIIYIYQPIDKMNRKISSHPL